MISNNNARYKCSTYFLYDFDCKSHSWCYFGDLRSTSGQKVNFKIKFVKNLPFYAFLSPLSASTSPFYSYTSPFNAHYHTLIIFRWPLCNCVAPLCLLLNFKVSPLLFNASSFDAFPSPFRPSLLPFNK